MRSRRTLLVLALIAPSLVVANLAPDAANAAPVLGTGRLAMTTPDADPTIEEVDVAQGPSGDVVLNLRSSWLRVRLDPSGTQLVAGTSSNTQADGFQGTTQLVLQNFDCSNWFKIDVNEVEFVAGVLTKLTGAFYARCLNGTDINATFAYPSDDVPLIDFQNTIDLRRSGFLNGSTGTVTVINRGSAPATVDAVLLKRLDNQFALGAPTEDPPDGFTVSHDGCTGVELDANETCGIDVHYLPPIGVQVSAYLAVHADHMPAGTYRRQRILGDSAPNGYGHLFFLHRTKVVDSRDGTGRNSTAPFQAAIGESFDITGSYGVPDRIYAQGVLLDVTAFQPSGAGTISVGASGSDPSTHTSATFEPGVTANQHVFAALASDGSITVTTSAAVHLQIDVVAWIGTDQTSTTGRSFGTVGDAALTSSKTGVRFDRKGAVGTATRRAIVADEDPRRWQWYGVQVTVSSATADAQLRLWADGRPVPSAPSMWVKKGITRTQLVFVPSGYGGVLAMRASGGTVQVELKAIAALGEAGQVWGGRLVPFDTPQRILNTDPAPGKIRSGRNQTWPTGTLSPSTNTTASYLVGLFVTTQSSGAGKLLMWDTPPTTVVSTRRNVTESGLGLLGMPEALVKATGVTTHYHVDAAAWVTAGGFSAMPPNLPPLDTELPIAVVATPPIADVVPIPTAVGGPEATVVGTGVISEFNAYDLGPLDTTDVRTVDVDRAGSHVLFKDGTTTLLDIRLGSDGLIAPGTYLQTDGGDEDEGGCGTVIIDVAQFDGGNVLQQLAGRYLGGCGTVRTGWFRYPASVPQGVPSMNWDSSIWFNTGPISGASRDVTISNVGTADLDLGTLAFDHRFGDDAYSIAADACSGQTLAPAGSCVVSVSFLPDPPAELNTYVWDAVVVPTDNDLPGGGQILPMRGTESLNNWGLVVPVSEVRAVNGASFSAGVPQVFDFAGAYGVPEGALAVVARMTATGLGTAGSVTAIREGVAFEDGVTMMFPAMGSISQTVIVPIDAAGLTRMRTSASTTLKLDVLGYVAGDADTTAGALGFFAEEPVKIVDSKVALNVKGGTLKNGVTVVATLRRGHTVGWGLLAVTVNSTAPQIDVRLWRAGDAEPILPSLTVPGKAARTSLVLVRLDAPTLNIKVTGGSAYVRIDQSMTLGEAGGPNLRGRLDVMSAPIRAVDTTQPPVPLRSRQLDLRFWLGLEDFEGATLDGLLGTLTARNTSTASTLALFHFGADRLPRGYTMSAPAKQASSASAVAPLGRDGGMWVYNTAGSVTYTFDVTGVILNESIEPLDPLVDLVLSWV